jgi:RNA polymerase sigma-70 factor (sigma-E family)
MATRERVRDVSQREFTEFYRSGRDTCLRAVLAVVGERALAEDLVAEAFTRAWASWSTVRRHPAPRAWVVRTALNTRVSWWRRRRREVGVAAVPDDDAATGQDSPELDPALLTVLRGLPRRQREVVVLRVFLDLDTRTTAAALGIAEGTVSAHLSRAVTTVRGHFVAENSLEVRP